MRRKLAILSMALCLSIPALAWGPEGHRIVAEIAKDHLNPTARHAMVQLLGTDDLASISTWADEIRRDRPETYGWHFVDIPWNAQGFDPQRDCYHPGERSPASLVDHHNCVVDRIALFERVLANTHAARTDRIEALKFLTHFVGDIHQPLHAVGEARGGNEVQVVEFGSARCGPKACNLHGLWDLGLIRHTHLSERRYVERLEESVVPTQLHATAGGAPAQWANESFRIARDVWLNNGSAVDETYYRRNIHIVDERLARAGLRLAILLNRAVGQ